MLKRYFEENDTETLGYKFYPRVHCYLHRLIASLCFPLINIPFFLEKDMPDIFHFPDSDC